VIAAITGKALAAVRAAAPSGVEVRGSEDGLDGAAFAVLSWDDDAAAVPAPVAQRRAPLRPAPALQPALVTAATPAPAPMATNRSPAPVPACQPRPVAVAA
jgi:hypothetical protein